jgi:hypothetical protein
MFEHMIVISRPLNRGGKPDYKKGDQKIPL